MSMPNPMSRTAPPIVYSRAGSVVFCKTKEEWGGLSNMAAAFPIVISGIEFRTSEALYQACRFPSRPDVQQKIVSATSPLLAKNQSKPFRKTDLRPDWDDVEVAVMRWCLQVKLKQNWQSFASLLRATQDLPIVEQSRRDDFWGAREAPGEPDKLVGRNVLGRLLVELRREVVVKAKTPFTPVDPLPIPDFLLYGKPIPRL